MMALQPTPARCERAQSWVSLRLDEELSELEDALLVAHLDRCSACSAYAESVGAVVRTLRTQPPELLSHPIAASARRTSFFRAATLTRAAAAVAAVAGVTTMLSMQSARHVDPGPAFLDQSVPAATDRDFAQLRALRVIQLGGNPPRRSGVGEFGAVLAQRR
jgi:predicted anti-sigma-YlaC factor YlaD